MVPVGEAQESRTQLRGWWGSGSIARERPGFAACPALAPAARYYTVLEALLVSHSLQNCGFGCCCSDKFMKMPVLGLMWYYVGLEMGSSELTSACGLRVDCLDKVHPVSCSVCQEFAGQHLLWLVLRGWHLLCIAG